MSNHSGTESGTPRAGGRPREYASAADRAKAWRDRQREAREEQTGPLGGSVMPGPTGALATAVPALTALAERIEAAVAELSDPAGLDERFEGTRAAVARQVADAEAAAADARGETSRARHELAEATTQLAEATTAAAEAWEAAQALEVDLEQERAERSAEVEELRGQVLAGDALLEQTQTAHAAELSNQAAAAAAELEQLRAGHAVEVQQLQDQAATATQAAAAELDRERAAAAAILDRTRAEHSAEAGQLREARDELRRGLESEQAARTTDRAAAEASLTAAHQAHDVRLEAAAEVAAGLREQIVDLRTQLVDARSERDTIRARLDAGTPEKS